ncbi:MAG: HD domain-containing protein [Syntrophomonadaceae bacterium]|nr:HD domain-containing protein [Syntrophomonadaceae bacterium]
MDKKGPYTVAQMKALPAGSQGWGKFLVLEKTQRRIKDGREVINLKIGDAGGEIDSVVWDNCQVAGQLEIGAVVGVLGNLGSYNNRLQLTATRIKVLEEDPAQYMQGPAISLETLKEDFRRLLVSVSDPWMQDLLSRIFAPDLLDRFFRAPAARKIHHNYGGGLLEHTLSVANNCLDMAENYPSLNRDMLVTGAILHDIGKIYEYEMKPSPRYTTEGRMMGHIVLGAELVGEHIRSMRAEGLAFPVELEWMIRHLILAHHGSLEFGSPVLPLFPEAFVLYMMDNLDAKLFVYKNKIDENDGDDEFFTNYDNFHGQYFFTYRYPGEAGTTDEE